MKKGKSKNGEQRYLCQDCGRTFGMGSGHILGTSRLPWIGNTYLDDSGRDSPASLNSTGDM